MSCCYVTMMRVRIVIKIMVYYVHCCADDDYDENG